MAVHGAAEANDRIGAPWLDLGGHVWSLKPHRLRFVFGDRLFASAWTSAAFLETPVERLGDDPRGLLASLAAMPPHVGALVIPSHPVPEGALRVPAGAGALVCVASRHQHALVELAGDHAGFLAAMPRKRRHEIARKHRRFADRIGVVAALAAYRTRPRSMPSTIASRRLRDRPTRRGC